MPYGGYRQMTSFKDVDDLTSPNYEEFLSVSRCLHISDVEDAQRRRMLVPQPIRNSRALGSNTRVLWFAPTQSMEKHNFYGNVSYVINWKTVLDKMGPHLYSIDQAIYADQAFTRILLTKMNYDGRLRNVNLHSDGSAILKRSDKYFHAAKCYCKNRTGHHELQIGIEVTEEDARWFYNRCTVMANNHTMANVPMIRQITRKDGKIKKYAPFKCFLYNTTLNALCPYQDSRSKIEATLASMNIAFSRSLPLDDDMETDKENINHNNRSYPLHAIGAISPNKIKPKTIDVSSRAIGRGIPSTSQPKTTDVSSRAIGRVIPSTSQPKTIDVSSRAIGRVIPSTSQPKTRPSSSHVHNDGVLTVGNTDATLSWNLGDRKYLERSSTTGETLDSGNVDWTVYPPRPNKLPPIARTRAVPTAGSGTSGPQHVITEPDFTWHPSFRTPPSVNPTSGNGRVSSNASSARSISTGSSPVTPLVRNDWSPIVSVARTPYDERVQPERSFTERLRRFMCC